GRAPRGERGGSGRLATSAGWGGRPGRARRARGGRPRRTPRSALQKLSVISFGAVVFANMARLLGSGFDGGGLILPDRGPGRNEFFYGGEMSRSSPRLEPQREDRKSSTRFHEPRSKMACRS